MIMNRQIKRIKSSTSFIKIELAYKIYLDFYKNLEKQNKSEKIKIVKKIYQ